MISRSSSSTYRLHFSGSTPATNHLLSSFFHSFEICKNCNIRESQPALHTHRTHAHAQQYQWPAALWQPEEETSWGMFDQSQTAAQAGEVTHSTDTSPVPPGAHAPPQHTTRFATNVGTCLRGSGTEYACVCVCVFNVWLSGLVKNSCGEAEDLWLNHSGGECTEEKVGTNVFMHIL